MDVDITQVWEHYQKQVRDTDEDKRVFTTVVSVTWLDSCQVTHGWQLTHSIEQFPITPCHSVGFLLHMTDEFIGLVQSVSTTDCDDGYPQAMGYMKIPRGCVTSIQLMKSK